MHVDFRYCSPARWSLPGGTAPPKNKKNKQNVKNDSRRLCLFVYLDLQAAGTDIC
jgi:hypothetical protein